MTLTPMMKQYLEIKEKHQEAILFFRLGDFYEMFFEDAVLASKELEITLTGRLGGQEEKIPMCGVPFHAADGYIAKLVEKGYRVAICEQVEDPKTVKGIVKREVVRVITPGTIIANQILKEKQNNYLVSIGLHDDEYGLAVVDVSTGQFLVTSFSALENGKLLDEIDRIQPVECVLQECLTLNKEFRDNLNRKGIKSIVSYPNWAFKEINAAASLTKHFKLYSVDSLGLGKSPALVGSAGAVIDYLLETQKSGLTHINRIETYSPQQFMILDNSTRRNLELTRTLREGTVKGTLLWVLDYTLTAMGGRLLKSWVEQPLLTAEAIKDRNRSIEELIKSPALRHDLRKNLKEVYDLERIISRVAFGSANAKDLVALKQSLAKLPDLKLILTEANQGYLKDLGVEINPLTELTTLLEQGVQENPVLSLREGGIIKDGYNKELDQLRLAQKEGKTWIANLELKEKEKTGIKSLKVGFNKVFGYYIEITKSNLDSVPVNYVRKQTLSNGERYITPELKECENMILGAEEKINHLEYQLFQDIREKVSLNTEQIQQSAKIVAILDCLQSLTEAALKRGYCKPSVNNDNIIRITEGRHPVVEAMLEDQEFIANDTLLGDNENTLVLITGPNMAGKSTYMRQVALIVLMAQIGSFVPAESAEIGLVDRIFTRVGASDDLATGQSTFMVEMIECQVILNGATTNSLVIMDEVGRGTSTYDGISIARALAEHLYQKVGCKTLFSTHYHELTDLEEKYTGIRNYTVAVKEKGEDIIFLRKVVSGKADRSYGIHVAKLAGFPQELLARAELILKSLEKDKEADDHKDVSKVTSQEVAAATEAQITMFNNLSVQSPVEKEIEELDLLNMTPLDAINKLYHLKKMLQ